MYLIKTVGHVYKIHVANCKYKYKKNYKKYKYFSYSHLIHAANCFHAPNSHVYIETRGHLATCLQ
jgi:hypothetical protein